MRCVIKDCVDHCLTRAPVELLIRASSGTLVDIAIFGDELMEFENVVTECRDLKSSY